VTHYTAKVRTLYFARPKGQLGPVKIGCATNVKNRIQQLRPFGMSALELVASIPGSMDDEWRIQSLFWHDRLEGEWFNWSRGLQILMDSAARGELDIEALPPRRIRHMPERQRKANV